MDKAKCLFYAFLLSWASFFFFFLPLGRRTLVAEFVAPFWPWRCRYAWLALWKLQLQWHTMQYTCMNCVKIKSYSHLHKVVSRVLIPWILYWGGATLPYMHYMYLGGRGVGVNATPPPHSASYVLVGRSLSSALKFPVSQNWHSHKLCNHLWTWMKISHAPDTTNVWKKGLCSSCLKLVK